MVIINDSIIKFSMKGVQDLKEIPVGVWLVKYDGFNYEYFLEKADNFTLPNKIYGDSESLADRYLNTFKEKNGNLGVVLSGLKGTGKSLTAKTVCIKSNMPVILISEQYKGTDFNSFISNIKQESIIFVDEFEKLYPEKEDQEQILSLLDGVFMGKKLFLFTSNETSRYSNYLINRPGRIHYMKEYTRIEDDMLDDIVKDNLVNQENSEELKNIINMIEEANIDMVFALISECNMYKENPKEAVKHLNIKIDGGSAYKVIILDKDNNYQYEMNSICNINPIINPRFSIHASLIEEHEAKLKLQLADTSEEDWKDNEDRFKYLTFDNKNYNLKQDGRILIFDNEDETIVFTPVEKLKFVF